MHICFNWDGTLIQRDVAYEASQRRNKTLGLVMDESWLREAQKTNAHYDVYEKAISSYTGVTDPKLLTSMMTDLFRIHYLAVVHERKDTVFYPGVLESVRKLHERGVRLSVVSTLRQEIPEYGLIQLGLRELFSSVRANTPDLQYSKQEILRHIIAESGPIDLVVGDRDADMEAAKAVGAKGILVAWGPQAPAQGSRPEKVIRDPLELLNQ